MIVVDTHVLVWAVEGDRRIGERALSLINRERAQDGVSVSPMTIWEASMLVDKDRLALSRPVAGWFDLVLDSPGLRLAQISPAMAVDAGSLPGGIHGDPADRMIIATARALGCPVLTADRKILAYAKAGHLHAIDARD